MANKLALLAAAAIAAGYAIYKLATYQTDAEKAQKRLNEATKQLNKSVDSEEHTLAVLKGKLDAATKGSKEYYDIKNEIISKYGQYDKNLQAEIDKVGLTADAYDRLTKSIRESFGARQYEKLMSEENEQFENVLSDNLGKIYDEIFKKIDNSQEASKLYEKIRKAVISGAQDIEYGNKGNIWEITGGLDEEAINQLNSLGDKWVQSYIYNIQKAEKAKEDAGLMAREKLGIGEFAPQNEEDGSATKPFDDITKKVKETTDAIARLKSELADLRSGKTQVLEGTLKKTIEDKAKDLQEAEKSLETLTGRTDKIDNQAEKLREQQSKYKQLLDKQSLERIRTEEDLQMQANQARINAMDEGSDKYIAQMELNFEKELQAIDRQKQDALRKKIDDARTLFDAREDTKASQNKGYQKKTFDPTGISLSDAEIKYFDELYKAAIAGQDKINKDLADKYRDFAQQRTDLEKKFNDDIEVLRKQREKAELEGNTALVERLTRAIAKATADAGKGLMSFDFNVLKESPEYIRAFEDMKNTSTETLQSLLTELDKVKYAATGALDPTELREYTRTIQEIFDELAERNPFQAIDTARKRLESSKLDLAVATGELELAKASGDQEKINKAMERYRIAIDNVVKSENNLIKVQSTLSGQINELFSAITGLGDAIGGVAGEIISFIGDIGVFVSTSAQSIEALSQEAVTAVQAVQKAAAILNIIAGAIQLMQKLDSILPDSYSRYEAYAQRIKEISLLNDSVRDYELAVLRAKQAEESWFSKDNLNSLRDAKKLHDEVNEAYLGKLNENQAAYQNQKGGGWLKSAAGVLSGGWFIDTVFGTNLLGNDYKERIKKAVDNLRIETRKATKGFLGSGIGAKSQKTEDLTSWAKKNGLGELFDKEGLIDTTVAQNILDNYGNKLVGQTKETLEALVELREQYDEYLTQLREYVSSLYEPLVDNFVDSLWDWFDEGKDALDSFKDYASQTFRDIVSDMMRTIVMDKVLDGFSEDIAALYEEYAGGDIDESELMAKVSERMGELLANYESNMPVLQNIMDGITGSLSGIGIDLKQPESSSSQESTRRGFETMSQDTASELNGRFTALQMAGEEIKNFTGLIQMDVSELRKIGMSANETLLDLRDIGLDSVYYLEKINKNTSELYIMNEKLDKIERNTRGL